MLISNISRRHLFAGLIAAPYLLRNAEAQVLERVPALLFEGKPIFVSGIRPTRTNCYRIEIDKTSIDSKTIIHNYGHGGGGITMSWGSATEVLTLLKELSPKSDEQIAILGCGVIGLTVASTLLENYPNLKITIYAESRNINNHKDNSKAEYYTSKTTSFIAGGQFSPTDVEHIGKDADFKRIVINSYKKFIELGKNYGIFPKINYMMTRDDLSEKWGIVKEMKKQSHRPVTFSGKNPVIINCQSYNTLLIEPPIFLTKLENDLIESKRVTFVPVLKGYSDKKEIEKLNEKIIINCLGFGAGQLFDDDKMVGRKGHLALLPAQANLNYLFSGGDFQKIGGMDCSDEKILSQYMFPRTDKVVIGGTFDGLEKNKRSELNDEKIGQKLINRMVKRFYPLRELTNDQLCNI